MSARGHHGLLLAGGDPNVIDVAGSSGLYSFPDSYQANKGGTTGHGWVRTSKSYDSGKWVFAVKMISGSGSQEGAQIGLQQFGNEKPHIDASGAIGFGIQPFRNPTGLSTSTLVKNGAVTVSNWGNTGGVGDVIEVIVDFDAGQCWFRKNGVYMNTGSPGGAAHLTFSTGYSYRFGLTTYYPNHQNRFILAAAEYPYTPPAGYSLAT